MSTKVWILKERMKHLKEILNWMCRVTNCPNNRIVHLLLIVIAKRCFTLKLIFVLQLSFYWWNKLYCRHSYIPQSWNRWSFSFPWLNRSLSWLYRTYQYGLSLNHLSSSSVIFIPRFHKSHFVLRIWKTVPEFFEGNL